MSALVFTMLFWRCPSSLLWEATMADKVVPAVVGTASVASAPAPIPALEPGVTLLRPDWGGPLTEGDYVNLAASWITREIAEQAMLRRVDSHQGREIVGQKGNRDC